MSENAHRIVAAVNFCEGIPTEALKAGALAEVREAGWAVVREARQSPVEFSSAVDRLAAALERIGP